MVNYYFSGFRKRAVAKRYGISATSVRNWVSRYIYYGIQGLSPRDKKAKRYSIELKLKAVKMVCDEGLSLGRVVLKLGLSSMSFLWLWVNKYRKYGTEGFIKEMKGIKNMKDMKDMEYTKVMEESKYKNNNKNKKETETECKSKTGTKTETKRKTESAVSNKSDESKSKGELIKELEYLRAQVAFLKKLEALTQIRTKKK